MTLITDLYLHYPFRPKRREADLVSTLYLFTALLILSQAGKLGEALDLIPSMFCLALIIQVIARIFITVSISTVDTGYKNIPDIRTIWKRFFNPVFYF